MSLSLDAKLNILKLRDEVLRKHYNKEAYFRALFSIGNFKIGLDIKNRVSSYAWSCAENIISENKESLENQLKNENITFDEVKSSANVATSMIAIMNSATPTYINRPYDPYPVVRFGIDNQYHKQWTDFDLRSQIGEAEYSSIWKSFSLVTRAEFEKMAIDIMSPMSADLLFRNKSADEILKLIPSSYGLTKFHWFMFREIGLFCVGSHLIDIFNRSNIEAMEKAGIKDPYQWEATKAKAFTTKDIESEILELHLRVGLNDPILSPVFKDELKKKELELRLEKLFKTTDPMFNVQRDSALAGLIAQKEFEVASALIAVYEKAPSAMINELKKI